MAITSNEEAIEVIALFKEVSNTDIVRIGSANFGHFGDKIEKYFPNIDTDEEKEHFMYAINSAGKQLGNDSTDYDKLVELMKQLFAIASDDSAKAMLSLLQYVQRTTILDEGETANYIEVLKEVFP